VSRTLTLIQRKEDGSGGYTQEIRNLVDRAVSVVTNRSSQREPAENGIVLAGGLKQAKVNVN
jgi:hypothetical protein